MFDWHSWYFYLNLKSANFCFGQRNNHILLWKHVIKFSYITYFACYSFKVKSCFWHHNKLIFFVAHVYVEENPLIRESVSLRVLNPRVLVCFDSSSKIFCFTKLSQARPLLLWWIRGCTAFCKDFYISFFSSYIPSILSSFLCPIIKSMLYVWCSWSHLFSSSKFLS